MKARCMNEMKYFLFLYVCRLSITMATTTSFSFFTLRSACVDVLSVFYSIFECVLGENIDSPSISIEHENIDTHMKFEDEKLALTCSEIFGNFLQSDLRFVGVFHFEIPLFWMKNWFFAVHDNEMEFFCAIFMKVLMKCL